MSALSAARWVFWWGYFSLLVMWGVAVVIKEDVTRGDLIPVVIGLVGGGIAWAWHSYWRKHPFLLQFYKTGENTHWPREVFDPDPVLNMQGSHDRLICIEALMAAEFRRINFRLQQRRWQWPPQWQGRLWPPRVGWKFRIWDEAPFDRIRLMDFVDMDIGRLPESVDNQCETFWGEPDGTGGRDGKYREPTDMKKGNRVRYRIQFEVGSAGDWNGCLCFGVGVGEYRTWTRHKLRVILPSTPRIES